MAWRPETEKTCRGATSGRQDIATLCAMLERAATEHAGHPALSGGGYELSYRELGAWTAALAHELQERGVGPEKVVAICIPGAVLQIVWILAVVRAGGAYLTLDPTYPPERLRYLAEDSGAVLVVTSDDLAPLFGPAVRILPIDGTASDAGTPEPPPPPPATRAGPGNLVYLIYTSGSTGLPKGVAVEHRNLVNHTIWFNREFALAPGDRILQRTPLSFDASVWEIFSTLTSGAELVVFDGHRADIEALEESVSRHRVTILQCVPSLLQALAAAGSFARMPSLRLVMSGGERLGAELAREVRSQSGAELVNLYGPTETTIDATFARLTGNETIVPIGRPVDGLQVQIVDDELNEVGAGEAGELLIGGSGVARGYHNRPDLTRDRFVSVGAGEGRAYRTGDKVRLGPDGSLEYLGRLDDQVKIRGHRIELGEVEAAIASLPGVASAIAAAEEDSSGSNHLVAYVVPAAGGADAASLRSTLLRTLPNHLVPSRFVLMDRLPLTPNGKVDRRALGSPSTAMSRTEIRLARIWGELLGHMVEDGEANFFDQGGHSLLALRLIARVSDEFAVKLSLRYLFDNPTIGAIARRIDEAAAPPPPRAAEPVEGPVRATPAQQGMWFLDQAYGSDPAYVVPVALALEGEIDIKALEGALTALQARHEALRAGFVWSGEELLVRVSPPKQAKLEVVDLAGQVVIEDRIVEACGRPFDLGAGPGLRAILFRPARGENVLLLATHHIVADGISITTIVRDLWSAYGALRAGEAALPGDAPSSLTRRAAGADPEEQEVEARLAYWRRAVEGHHLQDWLPVDRPRSSGRRRCEGGSVSFSLSREASEAVEALGRAQQAGSFAVLAAALARALADWSGKERFVIGVPFDDRPPGLEETVGLFVETLLLPLELRSASFAEHVQLVRDSWLQAYEQRLPLARIAAAIPGHHLHGSNSPCQVMTSLQMADEGAGEAAGLSWRRIPIRIVWAKFDLSIHWRNRGGSIEATILFADDLFDACTIQAFAERLEQRLEREMLRHRAVPAPPPDESRFERPSLPGGPRTSGRTVLDLFESWASDAPQATALEYAGERMSYAELDRRSNQVAHYLRAAGLRPGELVGLCFKRSPEMVVTLLAVAKAGGAFLPLDPGYPAQRLAYVIENSGVKWILTHEAARAAVPHSAARLLSLEIERRAIAACPDDRPAGRLRKDDLAYVIYTSGSSGAPKGVMLEHGGWSNLAYAQRSLLGLDGGHRVLQFASLSFDAAVWEIASALASGGTLVLADEEMLLPGPALAALLRDARITHATLPPSALAITPPDGLDDLRVLVSAGEVCTRAVAARWIAPGRRFINAYGPTETTVCATAAIIRSTSDPVTIGRSIDNVYLRILDADGNPCAAGETGELLIGGAGVGRGYLGNAALTKRRFVADPLGSAGARLYKTGDLARWSASGDVEFVGRIDRQVKLRGYRIELEEVEAAMTRCRGVRHAAAVVAGEGEGAFLAAFPVVDERWEGGDLREELSVALPPFMVPSLIVPVSSLPLTPNGKVDLAELSCRALQGSAAVEDPPQGALEEKIAQIWADVLGRPASGRHDNFFQVGGYSLAAVRVVSRIAEQLGIQMSVSEFMLNPSVSAQAVLVAERTGDVPAPDAGGGGAADEAIALPNHVSAWNYGLEGFHVTIALTFPPDSTLTPERFLEALERIRARNDALRSRFEKRGTGLVYLLCDGVPLVTVDEAGEDIVDFMDGGNFSGLPTRFESCPLMALKLWTRGEVLANAAIRISHMVFDGWSAQVFLKSLDAELRGAVAPRTGSYLQLIRDRRARAGPQTFARAMRYWDRIVSLASFPLEWRGSAPRPVPFDGATEHVRTRFSDTLTAAIDAFCRATGLTAFAFFSSALALLVACRSGASRPLINTIRMGRETEAELATIGFSIDVLPILFSLAPDRSLREVASAAARRIFRNFRLPGLIDLHDGSPARMVTRDLPPGFRSRAQVFYQHHPQLAGESGFQSFSLAPQPSPQAREDLCLDTSFDADGALVASWTFAHAIFPAATAAEIADDFVRICTLMIEEPELSVRSLLQIMAGTDVGNESDRERQSEPHRANPPRTEPRNVS